MGAGGGERGGVELMRGVWGAGAFCTRGETCLWYSAHKGKKNDNFRVEAGGSCATSPRAKLDRCLGLGIFGGLFVQVRDVECCFFLVVCFLVSGFYRQVHHAGGRACGRAVEIQTIAR